jgi:hypothetical protein
MKRIEKGAGHHCQMILDILSSLIEKSPTERFPCSVKEMTEHIISIIIR